MAYKNVKQALDALIVAFRDIRQAPDTLICPPENLRHIFLCLTLLKYSLSVPSNKFPLVRQMRLTMPEVSDKKPNSCE